MWPPPTSGTRDALAELILEVGCKSDPAMKALQSSNEDAYKRTCTAVREDGAYVQAGENDNLVVQRLAANPRQVGVLPYSYVEENLDRIKPVALHGVVPTYQTISAFKYPAARALYIYVNPARAKTKPALAQFVRTYSSEAAWGPKGYLTRRGLIPSPQNVRQQNAQVAARMIPMNPKAVQ